MDRSTLLKLAQLITVQVFYINKKTHFILRDSFLVIIIIINAVSTISIMLKLVTILSILIIMFKIKIVNRSSQRW